MPRPYHGLAGISSTDIKEDLCITDLSNGYMNNGGK